jgi:hypothetical protein
VTGSGRNFPVAIYSTFFVAEPDMLLASFPGWKLPLEQPVRREVTDIFGDTETIETRAPLWEEGPPGEQAAAGYGVVAIEGDYGAYLEGRLPPFVRKAPHWCSKGLTSVELDPLGHLTDGTPALVDALFAHPSWSAHLLVFRESVVEAMLRSQREVARKWAARMSMPQYTHSADGSCRVQPDWSVDDALNILGPLVELAKEARAGQRLYLLLEW